MHPVPGSRTPSPLIGGSSAPTEVLSSAFLTLVEGLSQVSTTQKYIFAAAGCGSPVMDNLPAHTACGQPFGCRRFPTLQPAPPDALRLPTALEIERKDREEGKGQREGGRELGKTHPAAQGS
jgi:hypothetical protein